MVETPEDRKRRRARERAALWRSRHPEGAKEAKARYRAKPEAKAKEAADFKAWAAGQGPRLNAYRRARYASDAEHRAKLNARSSEHQKANRAQLNAARRARLQADPVFRMAHTIGNALRRALRGKAGRSWRVLVGYQPADLVAHLESQFEPWMSWATYGTEWHVDHRRPVASFDLPREVALCWSLDNLQPLRGVENMSKGARFVPEVIPEHLRPA